MRASKPGNSTALVKLQFETQAKNLMILSPIPTAGVMARMARTKSRTRSSGNRKLEGRGTGTAVEGIEECAGGVNGFVVAIHQVK